MFPGTGGVGITPAGIGGSVGSPSGTGGQPASRGSGGATATAGSGGFGSPGTGGMTGGIVDAGTGGHANMDAGLMGPDGAPGTGGMGGSEMTCPLPTTFKWTSSGPLASPKSPPGHDFVSLKDFTAVRWNNLYHVFATVFDQSASGWNMVYFNFSDWPEADAADQFYMQNSPTMGGVAPQLFYFTPKKKWVLVYQWGASFSTSDDPSQPKTWSPKAPAAHGRPTGWHRLYGHLRQRQLLSVFCRRQRQIYQSKMPIDQFPAPSMATRP